MHKFLIYLSIYFTPFPEDLNHAEIVHLPLKMG
jgi:hypothetical protein